MFRIKVPATSANLGPGFDSCGVALDMYLTLEVIEEQDEWLIEHELGAKVAHDEQNLIIKTALSLAPDLAPHRLRMSSDIPLARGLGSSSSAIVAGIELANRLADLKLSNDDKLQMATKIEGHPDNVAPAILGGFVVSSMIAGRTFWVKHNFPACDFIACIPQHELLTAESRDVLPREMAYTEAIHGSSRANLLVAAVLTDDLVLAGEMMKADLWHEPYRQHLIPHFSEIKECAEAAQAYGVYLSGAGPTVMVLMPEGKGQHFKEKINETKANDSLMIKVLKSV